MKPYLVGIAGPSGAGKSFLAGHLARVLGQTTIVPIDAYYHPLDHLSLEERGLVNFDDPASIDEQLLFSQLATLASGESIAQPLYDFARHTRQPQTIEIMPTAYVIVEGLFTLHWPELRELLHTRVYVDMHDNACLERRLARDVQERGRTAESVHEQFQRTVLPMAEKIVRPSAQFADVRVTGNLPIAREVDEVLKHIRQHG